MQTWWTLCRTSNSSITDHTILHRINFSEILLLSRTDIQPVRVTKILFDTDENRVKRNADFRSMVQNSPKGVDVVTSGEFKAKTSLLSVYYVSEIFIAGQF